MFTQPKTCPNTECGATGKFFIKKGYFKTKWNAQPVSRYRCKKCGKFFSSHTLRPTVGQKKPHLNHEIYVLKTKRKRGRHRKNIEMVSISVDDLNTLRNLLDKLQK